MKIFCQLLFIFSLLKSSTIYGLTPPTSILKAHPLLAVKSINFLTHKLPMLDTFGHKNLELNDHLIPLILNSHQLSSPLKAELITSLVKFSQFGDNFGSWILSHYLQLITDLVNTLQ